ncbi:60Kd inner membrane protein-domain-containing protein [Lentinula guzmanii]|uniref:60Kd inner membrane protein-domain-containing protein n=1 Tax=Lentinula guzmanii TaxID=2804957 RepID=A0AA38N0Q7_9AGAR|nr:60Kd inner membrane protein-domain-containing protein [Lentinula guzmanii]
MSSIVINCFKSHARISIRFRTVSSPQFYSPQRSRAFSSQLSSHCIRPRNNPSYNATLITCRTFSVWPFSKTTPSYPPGSSTPTPTSSGLISETERGESAISQSSNIPTLKETISTEPVSSGLSNSLPEGVELSPPVDLLSPDAVDAAINAANTAHSIIPPALQLGDLASLGLISYTPAGLVRWSFELINVGTGLSWFWTIIAGTLFWRLALLPVLVKTLQFSSRMHLIQPQTQAIVQQTMQARQKGDMLAMQKLQKDQVELYKSVGLSPLQGLIGPVFQLPVALGMFIGLKKMCELPVPQLTVSGVDWLPDLTAVDPTGIMAPAFAVTLFWQMTVSARDMNVQAQPGMAHVMNLMRFPGAPLFSLFMTTLPSGLVLSVIVAAIATGFQSLIFRIPAVRSYFGILPPPKIQGRQGLPSFKETFTYVKDWWKNKWREAKQDAIGRAEQQKLKSGPPRRRL